MRTMTTAPTTISPADIRLRHQVDESKVDELAETMEREGWTGRPVVVYQDDEGRLYNITGCHRISAAIAADIEVPALLIDAADPDTLDLCEFAAANDDIDAASALREISQEIGDIVEEG